MCNLKQTIRAFLFTNIYTGHHIEKGWHSFKCFCVVCVCVRVTRRQLIRKTSVMRLYRGAGVSGTSGVRTWGEGRGCIIGAWISLKGRGWGVGGRGVS